MHCISVEIKENKITIIDCEIADWIILHEIVVFKLFIIYKNNFLHWIDDIILYKNSYYNFF